MIFMEKPHQNAPNSLHVYTFTLHALAKETLEQALAVLADSGTGVGVNGERVRHFNPSQHHLLHPDRPAAPRQDPLPRLLMGPLLLGLEGWGKKCRDDGQKLKTICRKEKWKKRLRGRIQVIGEERVNDDMAVEEEKEINGKGKEESVISS